MEDIKKTLPIMKKFTSKDRRYTGILSEINFTGKYLEATDGYMLCRVACSESDLPAIKSYPNCDQIIKPILSAFKQITVTRDTLKTLVKACNLAIKADYQVPDTELLKLNSPKIRKPVKMICFESGKIYSNAQILVDFKAKKRADHKFFYYSNLILPDSDLALFAHDFKFDASRLKQCLNAALKLSDSDTFTLYHRSEIQPLMISSGSLQIMIMPMKP